MWSNFPGADVTRAGNRTSASGTVAPGASRKALAAALDTPIAGMKSTAAERAPKGGREGKANKAPAKAQGKAKAQPKSEESKKLSKDLKTFLAFLTCLQWYRNKFVHFTLKTMFFF